MLDSLRRLFAHDSDRPAEPTSVLAPTALDSGLDTPFSVTEHLIASDGWPALNWDAARRWSESAPTDAARNHAWSACERAWLLHMRDALGSRFELYENDNVFLLTPLGSKSAQFTLDFVHRSQLRVLSVLEGIAKPAPLGKTILIVFDDADHYYRYVSLYYPDSGEFAFSSGMYLDRGCGHFVAMGNELRSIEPVVVHELAHSVLAHLPIPLWLNEGIAVNTEQRLGHTGMNANPKEMAEQHRDFWNESLIQEFWCGDSFYRTDDGNALSYDIARIVVSQLATDWASFRNFVLEAHYQDAGAEAARTHLQMSLGSCVASLIGFPPNAGWEPDPSKWPSAEVTQNRQPH